MTARVPPPMKHGELPDPLAHRYLLRELVLDHTRNYHPTGKPRGQPRTTR